MILRAFADASYPRPLDGKYAAMLFARLSLGAAFLSGIASRFGWWGEGVGYGSFENFVRYTAEVNAFYLNAGDWITHLTYLTIPVIGAPEVRKWVGGSVEQGTGRPAHV